MPEKAKGTAKVTLPYWETTIAASTPGKGRPTSLGAGGHDHSRVPTSRAMAKKRAKVPITFTNEDNWEVQFSHNNAVVITLNIKNYDVHQILIDYGRSTDVLYYDALLKMKISPDRLT